MNHRAGGGDTGPGGEQPAGVTDQPADEVAQVPAGGVSLSESTAAQTGEPRVDAALRMLDRLAELPVSEHPAVFERVHAELADVLGELDPESAGTSG